MTRRIFPTFVSWPWSIMVSAMNLILDQSDDYVGLHDIIWAT